MKNLKSKDLFQYLKRNRIHIKYHFPNKFKYIFDEKNNLYKILFFGNIHTISISCYKKDDMLKYQIFNYDTDMLCSADYTRNLIVSEL